MSFIFQTQIIIFKMSRLIILLFLITSIRCAQPKQEIPAISLIILFIFGGLLYGGIVKQINKKTSIPYTPMLFVSGVLLGKFHQYLSYYGQAVQMISTINPYGILMIFLPVLIFQSGFNADWHIFKKQFGQTFILAFPCVFFGSLLIMFSIKLILNYSDEYYSWPGAFMFGSILSCTDTVAVLALLKQIGAPKKFNSLIEGQSLLNDGSCMVLFQISSELVKQHPVSFFDIIGLFFSLTVGGVVLGLIFGIVSTYWIRRIFNDGILVVNITVISCYLVYFIAENVDFGFRVSGIIALVSLGLYMAAFGKTRISLQAESAVQGFWSYAVFCAQTTIFILAGVLVGTKVFAITGYVVESDFYKLLGLYGCMIMARFLSIAIFMRVLPKLGYGLTWKEVYVLTYGGLRGAIGISFSLIVFNDTQYSQHLRNIILFDMAGNVILTLLINGTTTGPFVKYLGLSSATKIKEKMYIKFIQQLLEEGQFKQKQLKDQSYLDMVNWNDVEINIGIRQLKQIIEKSELRVNREPISPQRIRKRTQFEDALREHLLKQEKQKNQESLQKLQKQNLLKDQQKDVIMQIRNKFLMALKTQYWEFLETNNTSAQATIILLEAANWDLDANCIEIISWEWICNQIDTNYIKYLLYLRTFSVIGSYARNYLFNYLAFSYDIVSSFIEANQKVRQKSTEFGKNKSGLKAVLEQSISNQKQAEEFLYNYLNSSFPQICSEIQTKKASFNILQYTKDILNRYLKTGQLDLNQYSILKQKVDKRITKLEMHSPKWTMKPFLESIRENQVFALLPEDILKAFQTQLVLVSFNIQQTIFRQGGQAKYIYFLRRGSCIIHYVSKKSEKLPTSSMLGIQGIFSKTFKSTIMAETMVIVHPFKISSIIKLLNSIPQFKTKFYSYYFFQLVKLLTPEGRLTKLCNMPENVQKDIINSFQLKELKTGKQQCDKDLIILSNTEMSANFNPMEYIPKNTAFEIHFNTSAFIDTNSKICEYLH